ncbi:unnamed protein product [Cuscuta campestris]|uniref:Uncharacterized protein n=1 Tax=Cuscuta campestris TaxID=132261 RepID=A0A484LBJ3_9ASTE|nr:unnamed protein product [Cuscuta campestris]
MEHRTAPDLLRFKRRDLPSSQSFISMQTMVKGPVTTETISDLGCSCSAGFNGGGRCGFGEEDLNAAVRQGWDAVESLLCRGAAPRDEDLRAEEEEFLESHRR